MPAPNASRVLRLGVGLLALLLVAGGLGAMIDPRSVYLDAATYPPYNAHFLHDIGSFMVGLGATLIAALLLADGLLVALAGGSVGAVAHAFNHFVDRHDGGRESDPYVYAGLALVFVVLLAVRLRELRR